MGQLQFRFSLPSFRIVIVEIIPLILQLKLRQEHPSKWRRYEKILLQIRSGNISRHRLMAAARTKSFHFLRMSRIYANLPLLTYNLIKQISQSSLNVK